MLEIVQSIFCWLELVHLIYVFIKDSWENLSCFQNVNIVESTFYLFTNGGLLFSNADLRGFTKDKLSWGKLWKFSRFWHVNESFIHLKTK